MLTFSFKLFVQIVKVFPKLFVQAYILILRMQDVHHCSCLLLSFFFLPLLLLFTLFLLPPLLPFPPLSPVRVSLYRSGWTWT